MRSTSIFGRNSIVMPKYKKAICCLITACCALFGSPREDLAIAGSRKTRWPVSKRRTLSSVSRQKMAAMEKRWRRTNVTIEWMAVAKRLNTLGNAVSYWFTQNSNNCLLILLDNWHHRCMVSVIKDKKQNRRIGLQ